MGPSARREILDCQFGDYNWCKVMNIGPALKRKFLAAACDMAEYTLAHNELCQMLVPEKVYEWTGMVEAWERDRTLQNPFEPFQASQGPTLSSARLSLAMKEATAIDAGSDICLDDSVTPLVLISTGIDLESEQRILTLKSDELWEHAQDRQRTKHQLRSNALRRKIHCWWQYQQLYCPSVVAIREKLIGGSAADVSPENLPLCLPSSLGPSVPVSQELRDYEWDLREGQAFEALEKIRNQLRLRACLRKFKEGYVRGQAANTRARNALSAVQARIDSAAAEYRASRMALISLSNNFPLTFRMKISQLRELNADDIREISSFDPSLPIKRPSDRPSQGYNRMLWIWKSVPDEDESDPTSAFYQEQLRIEFCKSRARAARFTEEVYLLREEIQRVIRFFEWKATFWISKASSLDGWLGSSYFSGKLNPWSEGHISYAHRQAAMYKGMTAHCLHLWRDLPDHLNQMSAYISQPEINLDSEHFKGKTVIVGETNQ